MKPQNPGTSENERQEDVDLYVAAEEEGATGGTMKPILSRRKLIFMPVFS